MTYDKASSKLDVGGKRYGYDELLCSHTKKIVHHCTMATFLRIIPLYSNYSPCI